MKKFRTLSLMLVVMMLLSMFSGMSVTHAEGDTTNYAGGLGTEASPYQIANWNHLNNVRNNRSSYFVLNNDLDENTLGYTVHVKLLDGTLANGGKGWLPIGTYVNRFTGQFDGGGYVIRQLEIYHPDTNTGFDIGLFAVLGPNAKIKDVGLENVDITGSYQIGGLVGRSQGSNIIIENTYTTGSVISAGTSTTYATIGGLIGSFISEGVGGSKIINSYSTASVSGKGGAGGLVGSNNAGTIENSYSTGNVTVTHHDAGGLVGRNVGTASETGKIIDSYSTGIVSNLSALTSPPASNIGGLVGTNDRNGFITKSYSTSTVIAESQIYIGGLVGYNNAGTIENSYSTGDVTGRDGVGGLVGINAGYSTTNDGGGFVTNSYSRGQVTGTTNFGGLVGSNVYSDHGTNSTGTVTNSYYNSQTSLQSDNTGKGEPRTTFQLQEGTANSTINTEAVYTTWNDSVVVWSFGTTSEYPELLWQAPPAVTYSVTYNSNEATGGTIPSAQTKTENVTLTLATNSGTLVRSGYAFVGWNTLADGLGTEYAAGSSYTTNAEVTLYAKWSPNLVMNGDFSLGNTGFTTSYIYTHDAQKFTKDLDAGRYIITTDASLVHQAWTSTLDKTNDVARLYFVANGHTSTDEIIWQTATPISVTEADTVYRFEAYVTSVFPHNPPQFKFELGDGTNWVELGNTADLTGVEPGVWTLSYADGKFSQPGQYHIRLRNLVTEAYGNDFGVDDIYFGFRSNASSSVAEPGLPDNEIENFSTPAVTTTAISSITTTGAQTGGSVTSQGTDAVTARGVVWSALTNPDINDNVITHVDGGIGEFTSSITGLTPGTQYFVRAYATNSAGTSYGNQVSFTTLNTYAVTYNANNATGGTVPDTQTKTENVTLVLATNSGNLVRSGYTFDAWNTQASGLGTDYAAGGEYTLNADVTLYAQWTANQYTITFDSDGGSTVDPITVDLGATLIAPSNPTKTNYTFVGWSPALPETMPAEHITLTAQWTINQYTITFNSNGGSAVGAITQDFGSVVTPPSNPSRTGYTFAGWSPAVPETMPTENITLIAQWTANQYTITFDSNGGNAVGSITQDYGTTLIAPSNPTKTNYTFTGWSPVLPATMPAQDVTLIAQWTINQYTITFNSNGGSTVGAITQDFGTSLIAPTNPTRTGYTFAGWSPALPETMPTENITLIAQWTINQYTIIFDSNGGSAVNAITHDYRTPLIAPTNPTKTNYTFAGWSPVLPESMLAQDVTLIAQWTINQYTITFNSNGGSAVGAITQDFGTPLIAPTNPTRTGYIFVGWYKEATLINTWDFNVEKISAENITLHANWLIRRYNLTYTAGENGSISGTLNQTVSYGGNATEVTAVPSEGYIFTNWSDGVLTAIRSDRNIIRNFDVTAVFTEEEQIEPDLPATITINSTHKGTGISLFGLDTKVTVAELDEEDVNNVVLEVIVEEQPEANQGSIAIATDTLREDGKNLLVNFEIYVLKTVHKNDGTSLINKVSNKDINGFIKVIVPIPEEFEGKLNLAMVHIDDAGNVSEFDTKLVTIDNKKYLEFETNHFSTFAMIEQAVGLPWLWILLSIIFVTSILLFIIKRKKDDNNNPQ